MGLFLSIYENTTGWSIVEAPFLGRFAGEVVQALINLPRKRLKKRMRNAVSIIVLHKRDLKC
jgi:hypothetical protein